MHCSCHHSPQLRQDEGLNLSPLPLKPVHMNFHSCVSSCSRTGLTGDWLGPGANFDI